MKDLKYYLSLPYEIIVLPISQDEGGGYLARYKDFPYIMGDGESEQEAINDAKKAFSFVIETDLKEGKFIKEPSNENEKVRVNVVLPRFVLDEIKARNLNRSQFLTNLAIEALSM
ncbi:type II toxin-antitoxin system HicB family antitoxin [Campylobacter devanensis]|uniref:type II toxin-antitoxin system HicB family antitoxin n=1 Tax=Campylobacter devanensis TaxID=3161138 RepID=UPI000A33C479|nr:HicB family protein [Campylobacter sp. P0088]